MGIEILRAPAKYKMALKWKDLGYPDIIKTIEV
jgi:hypothetical protein